MKKIYFLLVVYIFFSPCSGIALKIEAEHATIKTTGGPFHGGWNLYSNGTVGEYIRIQTAGTYEVTVYAYGSSLEGIWPIMALNVDGIAAETKTVSGSKVAHYVFQVELNSGVKSIGVTFLNDAYNPGIEDRNLYLDRIEIRPEPGLEEPVLASEKEWALVAKAREDSVLKDIGKAIKKNRMGSGTITFLDEKSNPIPGVSVTIEQIQHEFLFGCNIFSFNNFKTEEENNIYKKRFKELFNYATLPFYWKWFESEQGKTDYTYRDKLVVWCRENGIRMKGHPLLWDKEGGIPEWSDGQPSPKVQQKYVTEALQRYEGKIEFWEVVNESAHFAGISVANPYHWAREASPEAYLIVNDYGILADGYPPFFDLLKDAIQNGVPFDGIGIQGHEPPNMAFPLDRVKKILDMYAALEKDIYITEFTPQSNGKKITGSTWRGVWDEIQQADYAEKFYRVSFAHPAVVAITWWDLSDQGSWLNGGGMLRKDLSPKPVYETLKKLIHEEWRTSLQGKTDKSGRFQFSGFYGLYRVTLQIGNISKEAEFHLVKTKQNDFTYKLK